MDARWMLNEWIDRRLYCSLDSWLDGVWIDGQRDEE